MEQRPDGDVPDTDDLMAWTARQTDGRSGTAVVDARLLDRMRRRPRLNSLGTTVVVAMLVLLAALVWGVGGAFNGILTQANEVRSVVVPRINKQQEYAVFAARMGQVAEVVLGTRQASVRAVALQQAEALFGRFAADVDRQVLERLNDALASVRRSAARADVIDGLQTRVDNVRNRGDEVFVKMLRVNPSASIESAYFSLLKSLDMAIAADTVQQVEDIEKSFRVVSDGIRQGLVEGGDGGIDYFLVEIENLGEIFALRRRVLADQAQMVEEIGRTHAALDELSASLTAGAAVGTTRIADTLTDHAEAGLITTLIGLGAAVLVQVALLFVLRRHVLAPVARAAAALERVDRTHRPPRLPPALFAELDAVTAGVERFGDALAEMHESAQALKAGEERLRTILACSPFPIVIARISDGSVLYFNWQAEILFGSEGARLALIRDTRFFAEPGIADRLLQQVEEEGIVQDLEARLLTSEGVAFWALLSAVMIKDGEESAILIAINDITQRKKSEEETAAARERAERALRELSQAQESLIQAEKMASLGSLVAGVAHEVNTPVGSALTGITYLGDHTRAVTQRFNDGELKRADFVDYLATAAEACQLIEGNLHRAAELIQSFKQTAVDQTSEERRQFDLRAYLQDVFASLQPRLRKAGHHINVSCPPDVIIDSYPGALFQVLTNLTMNAINHAFTDDQTGQLNVAVGLIVDGRGVELRFADDGCGIPTAHRNRIFDPFFTTKRGAGGSGLGLHIVYNIVTKTLGGTIRVDSADGAGTTFILRFPITACSALIDLAQNAS